jgi:hypothetical protein
MPNSTWSRKTPTAPDDHKKKTGDAIQNNEVAATVDSIRAGLDSIRSTPKNRDRGGSGRCAWGGGGTGLEILTDRNKSGTEESTGDQRKMSDGGGEIGLKSARSSYGERKTKIGSV